MGYCVRAGANCVYQPGNETFSEGEEEKVVIVNVAYLELHVPGARATPAGRRPVGASAPCDPRAAGRLPKTPRIFSLRMGPLFDPGFDERVGKGD